MLLRMQGPKGEIAPNYFCPLPKQRPAAGNRSLGHFQRHQGAGRTRNRRPQDHIFRQAHTAVAPRPDPAAVDCAATEERAPARRCAGVRDARKQSRHQPQTGASFVNGLKQIHCGFALEQFGSGLNSFQLLKHVDANYLKLDRNFMAELPKNKENQEQDQGALRSGPPCRQADRGRIRRRRRKHVDPVFLRRQFRAGQFPAGTRKGNVVRDGLIFVLPPRGTSLQTSHLRCAGFGADLPDGELEKRPLPLTFGRRVTFLEQKLLLIRVSELLAQSRSFHSPSGSELLLALPKSNQKASVPFR